MRKQILLLSISVFLFSCELTKEKREENIIARVGNNYLYKNDIRNITGEGLSKEDSTNIVTSFINTWAKKHLLVEKAKINLSQDKVADFEKLVDEYRMDLYMAAYKEALIAKNMDTVVYNEEMKEYYEEHKENFRLNEDLIKLRYIHLNEGFSDMEEVKERFMRFDNEDKDTLQDMAIQFNSYFLNDSSWIKKVQFFQKVAMDNSNIDLKKSQFFELTDSLGVYLVHINDVLERNDVAPAEYVAPTLKQIILNKRKLEFIRNLEKDIINEAIQNKEFQVYENEE
ncbi:peptidyl-prolyl cis-trans isomerase [Leptobacterium sp. I13]|uniref:peptidyl-prolyl cis-trans isomerase n=1 Tax=Leptobacterium meishanense TaxID=3128904 RepID=UPI0030EF6AFB